MNDRFGRTELIFGPFAMEKLFAARVAVFGVGGVGGYVVEALARSGVGAIDVFDNDVVATSNINRQIIATTKTVGRDKTEVIKERILDINPDCKVGAFKIFYLPETSGDTDLGVYDYVVDAVDTVTAKIELAVRAKAAGVPIISCMGTGNKTEPEKLTVADIYSTSVCPLAKVMRRELKKRGVEKLKVVYSTEEPKKRASGVERDIDERTPASTAFVPAVAGLLIAGEVVKALIAQ